MENKFGNILLGGIMSTIPLTGNINSENNQKNIDFKKDKTENIVKTEENNKSDTLNKKSYIVSKELIKNIKDTNNNIINQEEEEIDATKKQKEIYEIYYRAYQIDLRKKLAKEKGFTWITIFKEGYAIVNNKKGEIYYINEEGDYLYKPLQRAKLFSGGKSMIKENNTRYLIDKDFNKLQTFENEEEGNKIFEQVEGLEMYGYKIFKQKDGFYVQTTNNKIVGPYKSIQPATRQGAFYLSKDEGNLFFDGTKVGE